MVLAVRLELRLAAGQGIKLASGCKDEVESERDSRVMGGHPDMPRLRLLRCLLAAMPEAAALRGKYSLVSTSGHFILLARGNLE